MKHTNAATKFYLSLFNKKPSDLDRELSLWQNIYLFKHEAALNK